MRGVFRKFKKGIVADYLPWLLIAVAVLAIVIFGIVLMKNKGISLVDRVGDLFRGR